MRVGLSLGGDNLNADCTRLAARLGVTDVVVHLNNYNDASTHRTTSSAGRRVRTAGERNQRAALVQ